MSVLSILLDWVSSMTDPMKVFRSYADDLNGVHNDALQSFRELVYRLDPNQALQQNTIISGDFANAIQQTAQDFLRTEEDLSLFESAYNRLLEIADELENTALGIETSVEATATELTADLVLVEVTTDVDIAAVAEGGANPIADVAGIILTIVAGAEVIDALKTLAEDIYNDVQRLKNDLHNLELATYPPTAPEPKHVAVKPPSWKSVVLSGSQLQELSSLMGSYGYLATGKYNLQQIQNIMHSLLQMGLTQSDIQNIMGKLLDPSRNLSHDQILDFLNGIVTNNGDNPNSPSADQIKSFFSLSTRSNAQYPLAQIVSEYANIAAIPGASRLLAALIETSANKDDKNKNGYRGYQFELKWVDAHRDQIARVEDIRQVQRKGKPIQGNTQAADVVFKSGPFTKGAVVDTKSYTWVDYIDGKPVEKPQWQIDLTIRDFLIQAKGDEANYPGYPLVFVFDAGSSRGALPVSVIKALTAQGVTVMTSPPDKVVGVGQMPQPQDNPPGNGAPVLPPGGQPPALPPGGQPPALPPGE